ncbi:hypothetical protein NW766_010472 [Fusarium irregulare]|uniref:Uncharacterized protein n=1 Tax=Fusarium irregulare TaxID=2494466 RepID=A0A9W8PGY9_9HYPO|nr:hypothetical protein NW766_010472 [Fusarium irregulare]
MRDLRFAISGAHVDSPASEDSGDTVLISAPGEEGTLTPDNDSSALASRSFAFQFEQRAQQIKKLIEEINAYEAELEVITAETPESRHKAQILENKRIKLSKLKTLEVTEALKSSDSKGLAEELANRGRSQVTEVTDEMNISGSLSIKYGTIGGSGKGSFVDSDKFKESDLNFFISVKVINQSINIKDALVYQALPSVNEKNFVEVFGDCFISGFLEGGEFNALVSMKVLNKDKKTEIVAEAKVAMTIGPVELEAEAKVETAKRNIQSNTETTIQVGWSGGGSIKPSRSILLDFEDTTNALQ